MFSNFTNIITGIWNGKEVHDKELLTRYVLAGLLCVAFLGVVVHIPSCGKQEVPSHIQTSSGR